MALKTDLQILIEELQKEYDYLKAEMKNCINEWEFEEAEALKKPLRHTEDKLRVLKNLENSNNDEMELLRGEFEFLREAMLNVGSSEEDREEIVSDIQDVKERISVLKGIKAEFSYDSDHLIHCLERIIFEEISCFELLVRKENIAFEICGHRGDLVIKIKRTDFEHLERSIAESDLMALKKIGFSISERLAEKHIPNFGPSKILPVLQLLARVSFEVLRLYRTREAVIKIKK